MKPNYIKYIFFVPLIMATVLSCSKMDATYADLVKGGEITYIGKPDSVKAHPGNGRIMLSWLLISDPKITKCRVFWNDKQDSVEIPITRKQGVDSVNVILNNMPERIYAFELYSYDNEGHSSIKVTKSASVYGDNYASGLRGREINTAVFDTKTGSAILTWFDPNDGDAGTEVTYTNNASMLTKVIVPGSLKANFPISLPNFVKGSTISYRTSYVPDLLAIDTFKTAIKTRVIN